MTKQVKRFQPKALLAKGQDNRRAFLPGEVVLIGAGPGDPELLTVRAHKLIQQADCVVYDRLVSQEIMDLVSDSAECIYVGKEVDQHTLPQDQINQLIVDKAMDGKKVARIKGGDPFIFGRGGEEVQELLKAGVPCRVVPGVTAASGCTTYAGIPLTHRDFVHGCTFITGHLKDDKLDLPWQALAREDHTLVVYMGIKTAPVLSRELTQHGLPGSTPVALIRHGTTERHQTYKTTLEALPEFVQAQKIKPPTLIVIGKVINALEQESEPSEETSLDDAEAVSHWQQRAV
ncbi:uroporphyrinogen-III C-methyltransferase [Aestuariirhabdus sp. Z084]|uniref:uroporphyrinogen-III C-methyltransferase n=1 Tax=Aestuariirhabdus haliotis TaxID=2918751 RepID=UPI00201B455B|nr:uroporphyrinogen-III C-methyltransferase [Aestuariirhabdus haliotis]MCL6416959.1 uroporphyrinogen-III C-methyltransferase [Aestuariirhabdus haliotis]MCL6420938.1 uroporphyrinogen-III C-methyltransferase [Aestuariirhabdus haliotis]